MATPRSRIEEVTTALGREPGSGLLVMPDNFMDVVERRSYPGGAQQRPRASFLFNCQPNT
jgi:hypothetical protein